MEKVVRLQSASKRITILTKSELAVCLWEQSDLKCADTQTSDISQHSHEIGLANLPYTRRGRKAAVQQDKEKSRKQPKLNHPSTPRAASTSQVAVVAVASTSTSQTQATEQFTNAVSMLAPLPAPVFTQQPSQYAQAATPAPAASPSVSHDRWENMATLFESVRGYARTFEYPTATVAALETVLIRLYLESPVTMGSQPLTTTAPDPNIQPNLGESSSASGHGSADDDDG
jgi:hypothetical protein